MLVVCPGACRSGRRARGLHPRRYDLPQNFPPNPLLWGEDVNAATTKKFLFALSVATAIVAVGIGVEDARKPARSQTRTAPNEAAQPAIANPRSLPKAGPLAEPKSLDQVGLPAELTRQAIPADNPQTPEKIALGEKLFFDGRLSADGTVACSTCQSRACVHRNAARPYGSRGAAGVSP